MSRSVIMAALLMVTNVLPAQTSPAERPDEVVILDFEAPDAARAWTNFDSSAAVWKQYLDAVEANKGTTKPAPWKPGTRPAYPDAKVALAQEGATSGKSALSITFDGGDWPTITTTAGLPDIDWAWYRSFKADVTVSRPCVVGFCMMQEKSQRGEGYNEATSRWDGTAFLHAGKNEVVLPLANRFGPMVPKARGKVVAFDIYMYEPRKGETIVVDNIRVSRDKTLEDALAVKVQYEVLGTDLKVAGAADLHAKLKDKWVKAAPQTLEQVEAAFAKKFEEIKAKNPKAVCVTFRDGEKGFDPANPDKVYAGWKDAYVQGHGPDGNLAARAARHGKEAYGEQFMRHRGRLMQIDLSTIPGGSTILAAQLVQINPNVKPDAAVEKSNVWVAEACNREWSEYEVNAYEYAKDKFWKAISGWFWTGDDPDFLPLYLAHGPSQGNANTWDFTEAVKWWTDGKHVNHGFFWHNDGQDFWSGGCPTREAKDVKTRPALMVIYEAK